MVAAKEIPTGYLFPGQGAQYIGMGKDVYEKYAEAREVFDHANDLFGFDVKRICFDGPQEDLQRTRYAQPAIFITSMACLHVFEKRFASPSHRVLGAAGLSLGEATALNASGAIGLDDGIRFVKDRGLFMDDASLEKPGSMAAVLGLDLEQVEEICGRTGAEVGNLNCPGQIVISGEKKSVEAACDLCRKAGARRCIPLDVSGAFHSACMNSACQRIDAALKSVQIQAPRFPVFSNLTAEAESSPDKIKTNLVNQMNHRTLWEASMRNMIAMGIRQFYEIGPGKVLKGLMRKIDPTVTVTTLGTVEEFNALKAEDTYAA